MKKNIFVILTLLFVMIGTFVFGATFSDVKGTKYQDAVDLLTSLKIVSGKTTSSFAPNDAVKRSEMAKMLVVALGRESDATNSKSKTKFPDVVDGHWATGYINVATELGLIKGYPDGKFAADDTVSYVEAITMLLRALNYEDINSLSWPTGYIQRAKDIGLMKDISVNNYDSGAIRGDVAVLLNNTLVANTREIVGSNANGMIYGNGKALISKSFKNYEYYKGATVSDIDDEKKEITITDADNKKHILTYSDKDIYELYGKEITVLYDSKNEKYIIFEVLSDSKTISGSVTKVETKKIYVKKVAYTLPSSSKIKLIGISNIKDAEEAYITMKDDTVTHVVAIGEEDLYIGITTTKSVKSNSKYKVTVMDLDGEEESYILADQSLTIKKNEILVYSLNEDDELVVKYSRDIDDSFAVDSVSKTSIKLKGKTQYTFSSNDKFIVVGVDDGEIYESKYLTAIDTKYDSAFVIEARNITFVVYFVDGLDDDDVVDDDVSATKTIAKNRLNAAIKAADAKNESSYTIESYQKLLEKLEAAESIKQSSASISTMDKASLALEKAIDNLEKATTADKTLRSDFSKLQSKIKEAKTKAADEEYTVETRNTLTKVITTSEKISIDSTTSAKVQTAINSLDEAIDGLISKATETEIAEVKSEITSLLKEAKSKKEVDYTKASYEKLKEAIEAAEAITDYTKERLSKLNNISNNLTIAIKNLVSYNSQFLDEAKKAYKEEKAKADKLVESNYTAKSWSEIEKYMIDVDEEYKDVEEEKLAEATSKVKELTNNLKQAMSNLIYTEEYEAKNNLTSAINNAKKIKESDWVESENITFGEFQSKISNCESLAKDSSATVKQLEDAENELKTYIRKYL